MRDPKRDAAEFERWAQREADRRRLPRSVVESIAWSYVTFTLTRGEAPSE